MSPRLKMLRFLFPYLSGFCVGQVIGLLIMGDILLGGLMAVFCAGGLCNWLVVSSNGWKMPVACKVNRVSKTHIEMSSHHRFPILADIIPIGPARASIGDLLIIGTVLPILYLLVVQI